MGKFFYVNNLGQSADLSEFELLFTTVGDVESLRLESYQESDRGFGVFEMKTEQQAIDCIDRFHGKSLKGQTMSICSNKPKPTPRRRK